MRSVCTIDGCDKFVNGHGYCDMHYRRFIKYGDPKGGTRNHAPARERFWRRVGKRGPEQCWFWSGPPNNAGYGLFQTGGRGSKVVLAHRFACEDAGTPIPDGMVVMHKCDVRLCCNPSHLRVGTQVENAADAINKGRHARMAPQGEQNGKSILTLETVRYIRARPDVPHAVLARELGVSPNAVRGVRIGRTWSHVT